MIFNETVGRHSGEVVATFAVPSTESEDVGLEQYHHLRRRTLQLRTQTLSETNQHSWHLLQNDDINNGHGRKTIRAV